MKGVSQHITAEVVATLTAAGSSMIGAVVYKLYKNEMGEVFSFWSWLRHMLIAWALGGFTYPRLPEGRMAAALIAVMGALSIQIMTVIDKHGLTFLLKAFNLTIDKKKKPDNQAST